MAEGAQAALLIDENGNFVGILQDGSVYRVQTTGKLQNTSGTAVDPATETTLATLATESKLEAVRVLLNSLDGKDYATQTTLAVLAGKDFATETTLATLATESKLEAVRALLFTIDADTSNLDVALSTRATEATLSAADTKLGTIDGVLDSIKDTDGIKKITDPLPAGDNNIGNVDAIQSGTWTVQQGTPPWKVEGTDADGTPPTENPVLAAGQDGTNVQSLKTDTTGRQEVIGGAADGAAPAGNPVLVAGQDGTNVQTVKTDITGHAEVAGAAADGAAVAANPVRIGGSDGTLTHDVLTDTGGRLVNVGAAADGATPVGDPVLMAGQDGTNVQSLKTNSSGRLEEVLYDSAGNPVGVVLDGSLYRLQTDSKVARGATNLVTLDAVDTTAGQGRLKATLYSPGGDPIAFPSISGDIHNEFVEETGGSNDLLVDGSTTPVEFSYLADGTYDIAIQEITFTLVSNSITFGSDYFGATAGPLPNGLLIEVYTEYGTTALDVLHQNEDFVNFASPGGFQWIVSSKDLLSSSYSIGGGLVLRGGSADKVLVTVRDDIDAAGVYFRCYIKGNVLGV